MEYKIIKYTIEYEERYKIVDNDGNTINDANGYGFKTKEGAKRAEYFLKRTIDDLDERLKTLKPIYSWLYENKELLDEVEDRMFHYAKYAKKFEVEDLREIIDSFGLFVDFKMKDILYCISTPYDELLRKISKRKRQLRKKK